MSQFGRRFDPSELPSTGGGETDLTAVLEMARELEAFSVRDQAHPTVGFEDRVMTAIGAEPPPRLVLASAGSLRRIPGTLLVAFRDAWGVATGVGRPLAVRAQAIAFVAISLLAVGSLSAVVAVGAASLLDVDRPVPQPTVVPVATDGPTPTPSERAPSPSPSVSPSPSPTETAEPSPSPTETAEPTETADPSGNSGPGGGGDDSSGPGGGDDSGGGNSGPGGSDSDDDSGSGGSGSGREGSDDSGSDDSESDDSGSDDDSSGPG